MKMQLSLGTIAIFTSLGLAAPAEPSSFSKADTIERDIAIIGGGSSGTHAAIRLKDSGKNVVVIEKTGELGGHVKTYTAASGIRVNYGPSNFQNFTVVQDFFARFNIPLVTYKAPGSGKQIFADFTSGETLPDGTIPAPDFTAYLEQLDKYPYLPQSWDLPNPIPEDLLLPFGEFITKYKLENIAYYMSAFTTGHGNVFEETTAYVMKAVDRHYIESFVYGASVTPASYDSHSIFEKALTELGSDALLSSTVVSATRSDKGVSLVVKTPNGQKLIKAKKLLVTAPPEVSNLKPLGLDKKENALFSKFSHHGLYVVLADKTGLENGTFYYNGVEESENYHVPAQPGVSFIWATKDEDTYWAWYSAPGDASQSQVESDTVAAIKKLAPGSNPRVLVYSSATPSDLTVPAKDIKGRFYDDLLSLQGYKSTWYTGAAWVADHSAALWNATEYVLLPQLLK